MLLFIIYWHILILILDGPAVSNKVGTTVRIKIKN